MEEEFKKAITELGGEAGGPVELSALKAKIRSYFRRALFKPVWEEETLALFFQSRPQDFEFDEKALSVRAVSEITKQIQKTVSEKRRKAPFPEALYASVLRSGTQQETLAIVDKCQAAELAAMPVDSIEALLESLGPPPAATDPMQAAAQAASHSNAQAKVLAAVPGALEKKESGLGTVLEFYSRCVKFGGEQTDARVGEQKIRTLRELCEVSAGLIREKGLGTVSAKALLLLCSTAPFHVVATAVAALGEKGEGDDVKACAATLARIPAAALEGLPQATLLQLAVASTKSSAVAEATLAAVARSCAGVLPVWSLDDISKLLLALSKAKAGAEGPEVAEVYGRACEALSSRLAEMSAMQLIKVALVLGKVSACREFFESLAAEAGNKAWDMPAAQLLLLTQALLPLGAENGAVAKVLEAWAKGLEAATASLPSDQLAKLAQLVAPVAPAHTEFWKSLGAKLVADVKTLTEAGWASVEAAFPDGAGPEFEAKAGLVQALKERKEKEEEKKRATERKRSRSRNERTERKRSRSRGERKRSRSRGERRRSRSRERRGAERRR